MNVQNNMNPILNAKQQQVNQVANQVKANVANKVAIKSSNLNLVDPQMSAQLQSQNNVPIAYGANGNIKTMPTSPTMSIRA